MGRLSHTNTHSPDIMVMEWVKRIAMFLTRLGVYMKACNTSSDPIPQSKAVLLANKIYTVCREAGKVAGEETPSDLALPFAPGGIGVAHPFLCNRSLQLCF